MGQIIVLKRFSQRWGQQTGTLGLLVALGWGGFARPSAAQLPDFPIQPVPQSFPATIEPRESAYTLGPGDRLRLDIFDVPEYSGEYQVLIDGTLNLPIIGSVSVRGLTLARATELVSQRYAQFVRRPIVTLSLLAARPLKVAIAGEVTRPGSYTMPLADGRQFPTLTQAVQLAGGITQSANVRQVQLRRQGSGAPITVNLWDLFQNGDLSQDLTLRDGDSIVIPTVATPNTVEATLLTNASFAAQLRQPLKVSIVGAVQRPGPYTLTGDVTPNNNTASPIAGLEVNNNNNNNNRQSQFPTVTKAIQAAGGIKADANIRQILVRRYTRTGNEQNLTVDLWQLLQTGDLNQDPILQDGDTIIIPIATAVNPQEVPQLAAASFAPNAIRVSVVGEVAKPGSLEVPPNIPLNQAILTAGGFNNRAKRGQVELIRLNPNGTVDRRQIPVDFSQGINEQNNPPLRDNDVVVVNRSGVAQVSDTLSTILSPLGAVIRFFDFFRIFN